MENDYNLVKLIEVLQSIDLEAEAAEENAYVIYDKDGNKILL